MLNNKNRLIHPHHFRNKDTKDGNDFFYRSYLNALQYYMDDPTCDVENISFPSMFLYSMGDQNIIESPKRKLDEYGDMKLDEPSAGVKKDIEFYSNNLVAALQFRLKDRQYVLDINTYKSEILKDFLDVDVSLDGDKNHTLFKLMMRNFTLKYFKDISAKESDVLINKLNDSKEGNFDGIYENKNLLERYAKDNKNRQVLELDGYFKTELKEWQVKYENKSLVELKAIDLYPYIDGILYDNNKYFIAIALTEKDENYIDDKTEEINKVFECSMFIYQNESAIIKAEQLDKFNDSLRFYLGSFVNNCSLYKLQEAMNGAIGEAADISRHWYSKGLDSIFNKETYEEFENDENSINFYTKFVKELLCKIDGVKNTEIYPFDRVFIFPETGLENDFNGIKKLRVLEAKIKSREPFDRGAYLMGWEQDVEDEDGNNILDEENDLIFSDKKINYMDWDIEDSDEFYNTISRSNKKHIKGNRLLSNLLLGKEFLTKTMADKTLADSKELVSEKRKIRDDFNEYGLFYEYEFGLNLEDKYPVLHEIQEKYFKYMKKYDDHTYDYNLDDNGYYRGVNKENLISKTMANIKSKYKAKTITVCFDPERITKLELAETAKYLKRKDAITMVFVADKDIVKTTSELEAEIKDFEVLIQMVIRQVIYNTESAAKEIEIKKKVFSVADSALHDAKALAKGHHDIQDEIDNLMIQVKQKLNTEDDSTNQFVLFESSNVYNEVLNRFFENKSSISNSINLEKEVSEWLPSNHNVSIVLNESFLPKMKILWDDLSISKSFKVLLKNATEYCGIYSKASSNAMLTLSMTTELVDNIDFLVVNIINSTPILTKSRFEMLNDEEIDELGKDKLNKKDGSTGVGVVSARRQIKSISSFNNIAYTMLSSNVISMKMYLKVELLTCDNLFFVENQEKENVETSSKIDSLDNCDVVYFEDSSEYYEENISFLKKYNISFVHSTRKDEKFMSDAKLLLTDMSILNNNNEADEEEGLDGIYLFRTLNRTNAPICVLSNGEAGSIKSKILQHLEDMIEFDDIVIVKDFDTMLEDGKIFILNNIKTLDDTHSIVLNYIQSISNPKKEDEHIQNKQNYEVVDFISKREYTSDFIRVFSKLEKDITQKHFYIANCSNSDLRTTDILSKWLEYKTARVNKGDRKFAISNVTYHKNILLIINDITLDDEREKWWLFYLGITHNIIFNFLSKSHGDILSQWSEIAVKRESSGYLGKLRHDVKNYQKIYEKDFSNSNLNKEFEKIINNTLELQKILQLSKYESLKHFSLLPEVDKLKGNAIVKTDEKVLKYAGEIEKITHEIYLSLKEAIEILRGDNKESTNVNNLKTFSNLIKFNIEFCADKGKKIA
ncbi:hypothetical protein [Sulfurimonas sp.]